MIGIDDGKVLGAMYPEDDVCLASSPKGPRGNHWVHRNGIIIVNTSLWPFHVQRSPTTTAIKILKMAESTYNIEVARLIIASSSFASVVTAGLGT